MDGDRSVDLLLIGNDDRFAGSVTHCLRSSVFRITRVTGSREGLQTARRLLPEVIVLDLAHSTLEGYTLCRTLRADPILADLPIVIVSAQGTNVRERIAGLDAGADDYLTKPCNDEELLLRLRNLLRRTSRQAPHSDRPAESAYLQSGPYRLDLQGRALLTPDGPRALSPTHFNLLAFLMRRPGRAFSPQRLLEEVWHYPPDAAGADLVRVHIKNLRQRIGADPSLPPLIETVPGHGYRVPPADLPVGLEVTERPGRLPDHLERRPVGQPAYWEDAVRA
jgi:two-component system response regulator ResD